uniref:GTPase-activating protein gyp7 isoform X1 n=1 Tax=Rhizophora mucronata TaxID=61149 RepID=A0A2P2LBQ3_RHIMU
MMVQDREVMLMPLHQILSHPIQAPPKTLKLFRLPSLQKVEREMSPWPPETTFLPSGLDSTQTS